MTTNFLVKAGIIVGSGGLIFGYDIGVIAGTISQLQTRYVKISETAIDCLAPDAAAATSVTVKLYEISLTDPIAV